MFERFRNMKLKGDIKCAKVAKRCHRRVPDIDVLCISVCSAQVFLLDDEWILPLVANPPYTFKEMNCVSYAYVYLYTDNEFSISVLQ